MILFIFAFIGLLWAEVCKGVEPSDPLEVYLLTSGPGNSAYTKMGHTALWVSGGGRKETVFNWGAYDSSQENFLWHFFMGTAEYKLAMMSRPYNIHRVKDNGQRLVAQHLNLSPTMKLALQAELARLARPENHVYQYHWEEQNCSTLIRNLINDVTNGSLQELPEVTSPTKRFEVLRHLGSHIWSWFGWHFMASDYGDLTYDRWSWMHIPIALHDGVGEATIQWSEGVPPKPLVDKTCVLNDGQWAPPTPPNRIGLLFTIGALIGGFIWWWNGRTSRWFTIPISLWFVSVGGLSSFFIVCWIWSSLDGYGFNENWFFANPILLLLPWFIIKRNIPTWWRWTLFLSMTCGVCWEILDPTPQINGDWIILFSIPNILIILSKPLRGQSK